MGSNGNGWVAIWVGGALFAALATGFASRGTSVGNAVGNQAGEIQKLEVPRNGDAAVEEPSDVDPQAVVLERSEDGHFYADADINGQSIRMLVDTGATAIALSRDDARRAGIGVSIAMPEVVGQGASGDVHGEVVKLDRVALGGAEVEDVAAIVLDDSEMSLLGQSFLSKFDSVEIRGDKMVLR